MGQINLIVDQIISGNGGTPRYGCTGRRRGASWDTSSEAAGDEEREEGVIHDCKQRAKVIDSR